MHRPLYKMQSKPRSSERPRSGCEYGLSRVEMRLGTKRSLLDLTQRGTLILYHPSAVFRSYDWSVSVLHSVAVLLVQSTPQVAI